MNYVYKKDKSNNSQNFIYVLIKVLFVYSMFEMMQIKFNKVLKKKESFVIIILYRISYINYITTTHNELNDNKK